MKNKPTTNNIKPVKNKKDKILNLRKEAKKQKTTKTGFLNVKPAIQDLYKPVSAKYFRSYNPFTQFVMVLIVILSPIVSLFIYFQATNFIATLQADGNSIIAEFDLAAKRALIDDYNAAAAGLEQIEVELNEIQDDIWFIKEIDDLVETANTLVNSIASLTSIIPELESLPTAYFNLNEANETAEESNRLSAIISQILTNLETIQLGLKQAQLQMRQIPLITLPGDKRRQLLDFEDQLERITNLVDRYQNYLPAARDFLGYQVPHRYLILLQNNNEARPGGGFIGSFIIADTNDGVLTKFEPYDVYQYDGQLVTDEPQPEELTGITTTTSIRDSNTSPNFAVNANKAKELLEAAGGPGVDTVIAVNQNVIEDLLKITGPITAAGNKINSDNFSTVFTYLIENSSIYEGSTNPKEVLFDFIPNFKEQLFTKTDQFGEIISLIRQAISANDIMAYSNKPSNNQIFTNLALTNEFPATAAIDELLITHTSVGGNKSDRYIKSRYIHNTKLNEKGELINTLTIRLFHSYNQESENEIIRTLRPFGLTRLVDPLRQILGQGQNVTRLKVYIPSESELIDLKGIPEDEFTSKPAADLENRHLFSYVARTNPQEANEVSITYKLPQKLRVSPLDLYNLQLHKASGIDNAIFQKQYQFPNTVSLFRTQPEQALLSDESVYDFETALKADALFQAIFTDR